MAARGTDRYGLGGNEARCEFGTIGALDWLEWRTPTCSLDAAQRSDQPLQSAARRIPSTARAGECLGVELRECGGDPLVATSDPLAWRDGRSAVLLLRFHDREVASRASGRIAGLSGRQEDGTRSDDLVDLFVEIAWQIDHRAHGCDRIALWIASAEAEGRPGVHGDSWILRVWRVGAVEHEEDTFWGIVSRDGDGRLADLDAIAPDIDPLIRIAN